MVYAGTELFHGEMGSRKRLKSATIQTVEKALRDGEILRLM